MLTRLEVRLLGNNLSRVVVHLDYLKTLRLQGSDNATIMPQTTLQSLSNSETTPAFPAREEA